MTDPVVLVGLPRSGSTLCTAVLNQAPELFVINDAYFLQQVDATDSWDGFATPEDARAFLAQLTEMITWRAAVSTSKKLENSSRLTAEQLDQVLARITFDKVPQNHWATMMTHVMSTAAAAAGKTRWGWNTPQDLYHVDKIKRAYPQARILFMMRDPFAVLKSFRFRPNAQALRRYHPLAQAAAWKRAIRGYEGARARYPDSVEIVRYEDLVAETSAQMRRMNAFLGTTIPEDLDLTSLGSNTSFRDDRTVARPVRREVSGFECWAADRIVGACRGRVGYDAPPKKLALDGLPYFVQQSLIFTRHYAGAFLTDKNTRKRILRFLQA
ncbi:sulfotransferase family protein [Pseudooceanicola sp. 200-1SW]|uniref:sulfotransferase family protein n=1 Tax=Pseudooceanicola sp. 200-1SW TaxID=3425949 RepID=UPI003D7F7065